MNPIYKLTQLKQLTQLTELTQLTNHLSQQNHIHPAVVGDQKVCTLPIETFKGLHQTFWNTNNGGKSDLKTLYNFDAIYMP